MGTGQPRARRHAGGGRQLTMARAATIREFEDWELNGATWRPLELTDRHAVVELCTCYGERVDVVESEDPDLIEFVRSHQPD